MVQEGNFQGLLFLPKKLEAVIVQLLIQEKCLAIPEK